jgi:cytochrome c oxidase subunit 3
MEAAAHAAHEEHHGPPTANVSSRVEAQFLGMLLFIISEIMLFGAFFTAYFFIRVVGEAEWFPVELPVAIAAVNSAILLTSSVTMHWALEGVRRENRNALRIGLLTTFLLGLTFLTVQVNETSGTLVAQQEIRRPAGEALAGPTSAQSMAAPSSTSNSSRARSASSLW